MPVKTAGCCAAFALLCGPVWGDQPPPPQAPQSPPATPATPAPPPADSSTADEGFIEFLGGDDVGDADLWDYLKKSVSAVPPTPAPPPQESKP